jgi:hypothetical protein
MEVIMQTLVLIAMIGVLIFAPAEVQASGKWIKCAAFPEPSEELVGDGDHRTLEERWDGRRMVNVGQPTFMQQVGLATRII